MGIDRKSVEYYIHQSILYFDTIIILYWISEQVRIGFLFVWLMLLFFLLLAWVNHTPSSFLYPLVQAKHIFFPLFIAFSYFGVGEFNYWNERQLVTFEHTCCSMTEEFALLCGKFLGGMGEFVGDQNAASDLQDLYTYTCTCTFCTYCTWSLFTSSPSSMLAV